MHDSEVVASIAVDHSGGLAEAYDRYADPLYKYCLALLGEPAEAADTVRDTFVIAAARLAGLREPHRLRAWLYTVARNECQRITRPGRPVFAPAQAPDVTADAADVREDAERARLRGLLDAAATGLTPGEREVIELELRQGLAAAEVAAVLGVSRNRANALASRAREQLEACLGALVVARAGQRGCGELSRMLAGWDGRLTVPLRKQLHRHIGRCAACSTRRDLELHPVRLFGQSPGEALAAAAADSLRVAVGPPDFLRAHTLALAAGQDPGAIAHRATVLGEVGAFDSHGFPKPVPGPKEAPARGDGGGPARRRGRVAVAAGVVAAAVIGAVAFALVDSSGHGKLAGGQLSGSAPSTGPSAAAPSGAAPGASSSAPTTSPTSSATRTAAKATATPKTTGSATTAPRGTPTAPNRATTPAAPPSATTKPTATGTASTPTPTAKAAPGTLAVSPSGGALWVPPGGTTISLAAQGGPVTWSSTVSSGIGTVHLSPSGGTINAGATVTVTVTASSSASGQHVTINPGGTVFTIFIALAKSRLEGLDQDGFIEREGALSRVPQAFAPVVEATKAAILRALSPDRLHSAYLYGSIPRGTAVPATSDLDVLLALHEEPGAADQAAASRMEDALDARFPQIDGAGILLASTATLLSDIERHDLGWFVACLYTPLTGEDLAARLARYRPTSLLARETNGDIGDLIPRWQDQLSEACTDASLRALSRRVARRLVRTGFTLVMPRWRGWTSDLGESATVFGHYYPARRDQMQIAAAVARTPAADRPILSMLINVPWPPPRPRVSASWHSPTARRSASSRWPRSCASGWARSPSGCRRKRHRETTCRRWSSTTTGPARSSDGAPARPRRRSWRQPRACATSAC